MTKRLDTKKLASGCPVEVGSIWKHKNMEPCSFVKVVDVIAGVRSGRVMYVIWYLSLGTRFTYASKALSSFYGRYTDEFSEEEYGMFLLRNIN